MGLWGKRIRERYAADDIAATFAVDADAIDPAVFGLASYSTSTSPAPKIARRSAIQVPAVKRARDLIAGGIGSLPMHLYDTNRNGVPSELLDQPEAAVPRSVTLTRTAEDLLFEGIAWWEILDLGRVGDSPIAYPSRVVRLDPRCVNVRDGKVYHRPGTYTGATQPTSDAARVGKERQIPDDRLIRFDSPNDALLDAGARAIRTCLQLDAAAARYADEPLPLGWFSPADPASEPEDDAKIVEILNTWATARQTRATGYVPASLKYNTGQFSPEQLQLADARQHAVLEISRVAGIDPEELGVSTTSRTYANQFDRRKQFLDFTLGAYTSAITDRLSMPDVTPPGHYVRFNLDAFLRSDTASRYAAYEVGLRVGALTPDDIAALEDKPTPKKETPVSPTLSTAPQFADTAAITLDAPASTTFAVDTEARTITGLAVPYGKTATSRGRRFQFARGALRWTDPSRVKLYIGHDPSSAVGYALSLDDREDGLYATFKVARGPEGDRALSLAEDRVLDGLSAGLGEGGTFNAVDGIQHGTGVPLKEISLTPCPAFDDARVGSTGPALVGAGAALTFEGEVVSASTVDTVLAGLTQAIRDGFATALTHPQARPIIPAGGSLQVAEELPYRFDGSQGGAHGFLADMRGYNSGDNDARQRIDTFFADPTVAEVFAVTKANVSTLNPTTNRPDLYVGNLQYSTPLWDLVSTGTLDNATPFTIPKFATATGLVGNHTEGTEPTPGAFTATNQTITPAPLSGKIEINREVWDAEGNPQADAIIWQEMLNAWFEAREAKIAALLNAIAAANTLGGAELNLASAVDGALASALTTYLAGLQFVRGGNRFTAFAADGTLFPALVSAKDTAGRPIFPVLGPTNANGTTGAAFDRVMVGNLPILAAWGLSSGNAANSYNFVPSSVWAWASAPKKFTFEYQVKSIDMAIWGYMATGCIREADVKRIDYTAADV